jgi:hypothetical protein
MDNKTRLERLQHAISVMERVAADEKHRFNILRWQDQPSYGMRPVVTEERALSCGTVCCFGGWLSLDAQAKSNGLAVDTYDGRPLFGGERGSAAIAAYLGIAAGEGQYLTMPNLYPCLPEEVKPADVICRLEKLVEKYSQESAA